ncbi:MAG TPA: apolipoprotein N-acyltransferase [Actinomycetota bacterium]|nr:apolipoprotein N-acyltransferase [Actinomycetota bacterium]
MPQLLPGEASEPAEGQGEDALPGLRLRPNPPGPAVALLIAASSGALLSLSLPPVDAGWVAFLAPIPFLWLVRDARPLRGLGLGLAFGVAYFGLVLYWILLFGELGWTALVLVSACFTGVFGLLAPVLWREEHPVASVLALASLWTVLEAARGAWPLGGFAWGQLGSTQTGNPALLRLASVTGVWGISFVVIAVAGLLLLALERGSEAPARTIALMGVCIALVLAPGLLPLPAAEGQAIDVAAIQVDVRQAEHLSRDAEDIAVARMNIDLHTRLANDPPDLAVWGEGSLDPGASSDPATMQEVSSAVAAVGAPTLAGAVLDDPDGSQHTSVLLFDGTGATVDRYDKVVLVPFGEYVPFRDRLEWIDAIDQVPVDRVPGETPHTVSVSGLPAFGTPICYENSFPRVERDMARRGATFFVLTTNNASYGMTAASRQHVLMSRLRAVETGRWVVHAAVSGISAIVDPQGDVVAHTELFEPEITRTRIRASRATTMYVRLGDWLVWVCLAGVLAMFAVPRSRRGPGRSVEGLADAPRTLVVLPTYNERVTIGEVLDGLLVLDGSIHMLVVDDGSPDGTGELVAQRAASEPRVRLLERDAKRGLASAYLEGFRLALEEGYDLVVEMDSDLSHLPEQLPGLLEAVRSHHLVVGSRYVPGGSVTNWSRARLALSRGGNLYARLCLGFPLHDATSGFRVYRRALLQRLIARPFRSDGYGFQVELAYRAWREGFDVGEVPITFREREHGHSKISRRIVVEALWLVTVWGLGARLRASVS